ncbi:MAG: metalloprotease PmbA [Gammaproteobacteria bacterium]|nr:MAG: metalloprotease PmbA [Gammaproteobacteria bacterium]
MTDSSMVAQAVPDRDQELSEIAECAEAAISHASRLGADSSEVSASMHIGLNVNVRLGEVETLEHSRDRGMGVSVYINASKGHASSGDLRVESIRSCVEKAIDIARFTQADKCNGLAPAERLCKYFPDLDLWHPQPLDAVATMERALACEAAGLDCPDIANSDGATASASFGLSVYANSSGFTGHSDGTRYGQSCVLIAGQGDSMQRDYWYDSRRAFSELEDIEKTGQEAARRTAMRLGARKIPTCEVPVLFSPEVAKGIVGHLLGAISGGALYRNASFLKDSAGQQLFADWMRMSERPFIERGPSSTAFDAEGVATSERDIICDGVLTGYVLGSYSACRLSLETTANAGGVHNLLVEPGQYSAKELLQQMGTGLLVTEVMGQGVSIVTGDYSRGAAGFWIENGEIQYPVDEVTIASHLKDMFMSIEAIGTDVDNRSNIQTGSMLMGKMTVAGS